MWSSADELDRLLETYLAALDRYQANQHSLAAALKLVRTASARQAHPVRPSSTSHAPSRPSAPAASVRPAMISARPRLASLCPSRLRPLPLTTQRDACLGGRSCRADVRPRADADPGPRRGGRSGAGKRQRSVGEHGRGGGRAAAAESRSHPTRLGRLRSSSTSRSPRRGVCWCRHLQQRQGAGAAKRTQVYLPSRPPPAILSLPAASTAQLSRRVRELDQ